MSRTVPPSSQPVATGKEYADALKGVLASTAAEKKPGRDEKKAPGRRSTSAPMLILFIGVGAPYAAWENYRYSLPPEPPSVAMQERAARVMMFSAVQLVEEQRRMRGILPAEVASLPLPRADWLYARADTGYTLSVTLPGTTLSFQSGEDHRRFLREAGVK